MAITVPPYYTGIHDEEVTRLVASQEESLKKIIQNQNYLGNIFPVGVIIFVQLNQVGVPPVDSALYQFCDGAEITDPKSKLRSIGLNVRFVPEFEDKFVRAASALQTNGTGGNKEFAVGHDHGGNTGSGGGGNSIGEEGDERKGSQAHEHTIDPDLSTVEIDYPAYIGYAAYMKIK